jgi:hypothetical protein
MKGEYERIDEHQDDEEKPRRGRGGGEKPWWWIVGIVGLLSVRVTFALWMKRQRLLGADDAVTHISCTLADAALPVISG